MAIPDDALHELASLAGVVLQHDDFDEVLGEICRISVRAVPGAEGASFTTWTERGPGARAASDEWAGSLDELQFIEREGPCLDAARSGLVFRVRDASTEHRWPSYMPQAVERGVGSVVSLPISAESKLLGALNIYSRARDAFDAEAVSVAEVVTAHAGLAAQVAGALSWHRDLAAQLQQALQTRVVIEQAKGVLMEQSKIGPDTAFDLLRRASQRENRKLHDVARDLVRRYADVEPHA